MKTFSRIANYLALGAVVTLVAACTSQMEPAKKALAGIDNVITAATPDASKYAPSQLTNAQSEEANLKAAFDRKEYAVVLGRAPSVLSDAQSMAAVAVAKKREAEQLASDQWTSLHASIPQRLLEVQTRVHALSRFKHAPRGVDLTVARSDLAEATTDWDTAQATFKSGDVEKAVMVARDVQTKLQTAATALKPPPGHPAQ